MRLICISSRASYYLPVLYLWMGQQEEAVATVDRYEEQGDPRSDYHHTAMAHRCYRIPSQKFYGRQS